MAVQPYFRTMLLMVTQPDDADRVMWRAFAWLTATAGALGLLLWFGGL